MDDENRKEENEGTSTSKKKDNKDRTGAGEYEEAERERDEVSYSSSLTDFSARSRALKLEKKREATKYLASKGPHTKKKHTPRVRRGRVTKRKRAYQPSKRKNRMRPPRDDSVSTKFTISNGSPSRSCNFCGHRCCGRRYDLVERETQNISNSMSPITNSIRKCIRKPKTLPQRRKKKVHTDPNNKFLKKSKKATKIACKSGLAVNQVGSTAKVLSPLLISTNDTSLTENEDTTETEIFYSEITPEMIYDVLARLTLWKQIVSKKSILDHMTTTYPVNPNKEQLAKELQEKLAVSAIAGITMEVMKNGEKYYCLTCELMEKGLEKNHVDLFWQIYTDTMSPVTKRTPTPVPVPVPASPPAKPGTDPKPSADPKPRNKLYDLYL